MNVRKIYLIIKMIFCFYYIIRSWHIVFTSVLFTIILLYKTNKMYALTNLSLYELVFLKSVYQNKSK